MIVILEIAATIYLLGALVVFMRLRAIILTQFSELGWPIHRGAVAKRSAFWFVSGSLYYWNDAKWEREKQRYE